jgi:purine-binding chemotaxis protein CheW
MSNGRGASGVKQLLICRVSSKLCGLPLEHVLETMRPLPLEELANMPSFVRGVALIRGRPTPVLDGRSLLGSPAMHSASARLVTFKLGERQVALWVDAVVGIRSVEGASLEQLPPLLRESQAEQVDALGTLDAELLLVLEHTRLLTEAHFRLLAEASA